MKLQTKALWKLLYKSNAAPLKTIGFKGFSEALTRCSLLLAGKSKGGHGKLGDVASVPAQHIYSIRKLTINAAHLQTLIKDSTSQLFSIVVTESAADFFEWRFSGPFCNIGEKAFIISHTASITERTKTISCCVSDGQCVTACHLR